MNNPEALQFGFVRPENEQLLCVAVPNNLYTASLEVPGVSAAFAQTEDLLVVEPSSAHTQLYIVPKAHVATPLERMKRNTQLGRILTILDALDNVAHPDNKDPRINISTHDRIGQSHINGLRVRLQLPETIAETDLASVASDHMRSMATQLAYKPDQDNTKLVKAIVSRSSDIQLHADSKRFSHSLSTDVRVDPLSSERLLMGHGLHSNERKFICIAGAVAIAHAPDLLS